MLLSRRQIRYSRSEKLKWIWFFAHLIVPLILRFLGTPARKYKRKKCFSFVLLSLIRTLDLKVEGTPVREFQRKKCFSLEFHSLNRTSDLKVEGTPVRESKKKFGISFWILLT